MIGNYLATPTSTTTFYIKYHPETKILEIRFRTTETYHYLRVPLQVWKKYYKAISAGGSSGKFFNEHIKDKYEFIKIT
jgi:hypothetical protein